MGQHARAQVTQAAKPSSALPARQQAPQRIFRRCACGATCDSCAGEQDKVMRRAGPGPAASLPALPVTQPGDALEVEADRMADAVRRKPAAEPTGPLAPTVSGSGGSPLPANLRTFFEARFAHDLGGVRVHTDSVAAASARDLHAEAYTIGGNIHFARDQFAPATSRGRDLLAHELAHVVQQGSSPALRRQIMRSACPHDAPQGSGCGLLAWKGADNALDDFVDVGTDRIIAVSLQEHFGGKWIPQLLTPPNPVKKGKARGYVDAAKVSAAADLRVEVVEIKSRNTMNGGCKLALDETTGYIGALKPLAPHIATLSAGLAREGGFRTDQCRKMTKDEQAKLTRGGVDFSNADSVNAWCTYNDLQNKLNTTFTKPFGSVTFTANTDGKAGSDYLVGTIPITCKRGKKTKPGIKKLIFQVNAKGGLSYRCDKRCSDQPEDEKEKEKDKPIEVPKDKEVRRTIEQTDPDDDTDPMEDDYRLPPSGIDSTDVAIITATGVASIALIHKLLKDKVRTEAEKRLLRETGKKVIEQMERKGAYQAAKAINGANAAKWGTKAGEEVIKKGEEMVAKRLARTTEKQVAERLAQQMGKTAAKQTAKTIFKGALHAIPFVFILLDVKDALAGVIQLSRGAELEIGLSANESDLGSGTDVKIVGDKGSGKDTAATVKLDQTEVDLEVKKAPDIKGVMDIETDKVTIKGKVDATDGDPVLVNMKIKIGNSTIVYRSAGKFKGGNIVIDGGLDITDSTIEVDLPPDAVLEPPEPGKTTVLKGVKVKVTKVGSGGGAGAGGPQKGLGGTAEKPGDKPGEKQEAKPTEQEQKLVGEIKADPNVKKVYDAVIGPKGIKMNEAALRRFLAIKDALKQKPALADRIIALLAKAEIKDPIKDLIEPMEAELKKAAEEDAKKTEPQPLPQDAQPADKDKDKDKPSSNQPTVPKPAVDPCVDAAKLELWPILQPNPQVPPDTAVKIGTKTFDEKVTKPTDTAVSPLYIGRKTSVGLRRYTVWLHGKDMKKANAKDITPGRFVWAADYEFTAPTGPVKSDAGDQPICFSDGGTTKRMIWGMLHKGQK
jgi:hypothetical protein